MTEVSQPQALVHPSPPSPLGEAHRRLGATMEVRDGWSVPARYGDPLEEYRAIRDKGAGVCDLSPRGLVEVAGGEAVQFLNGLITNDVKSLEEGAWMLAAFPNAQGRLIATSRVMRTGDLFLFDTEAATAPSVLKVLERFTLAGDFHVRDRSRETVQLSVQGAQASEVVARLFGAEAGALARWCVHRSAWGDASVLLMRATHTAEDGFDLFVEADGGEMLWQALTEAGARPVGQQALEVLRIEAGEPHFGRDMNETNVVLETGLDEAVSFTKGCYIGQEIIARIHWRGHVAKRLAGLVFDDEDEQAPPSEAKIRTTEGREIGRVTSSAYSPRLARAVALAYLKYDYLAAGTALRVAVTETEERAAHVVELPFVRGSWYEQSAGVPGMTGG